MFTPRGSGHNIGLVHSTCNHKHQGGGGGNYPSVLVFLGEGGKPDCLNWARVTIFAPQMYILKVSVKLIFGDLDLVSSRSPEQKFDKLVITLVCALTIHRFELESTYICNTHASPKDRGLQTHRVSLFVAEMYERGYVLGYWEDTPFIFNGTGILSINLGILCPFAVPNNPKTIGVHTLLWMSIVNKSIVNYTCILLASLCVELCVNILRQVKILILAI